MGETEWRPGEWCPGMRAVRRRGHGEVEYARIVTTSSGFPQTWAAWSVFDRDEGEHDDPVWCTARDDGWPDDAVPDLDDIGTSAIVCARMSVPRELAYLRSGYDRIRRAVGLPEGSTAEEIEEAVEGLAQSAFLLGIGTRGARG